MARLVRLKHKYHQNIVEAYNVQADEDHFENDDNDDDDYDDKM